MEEDRILLKLSENLARESGKDQEVLLYSLRLIKSSIMGYLLLIIVSGIFGVWEYALTAGVTASIFRVFSGGAHSTAPSRCSIIGVIIFTLFGLTAGFLPPYFLSDNILYLILLTAAISVVIFYQHAPADTPSKPINSQAQKAYLRAITFGLTAAWTAAALLLRKMVPSSLIFASATGLLWQAFTTIPVGYSTVGSMDRLLKILMERRDKG